MGKIIIMLFCIAFLLSCKKDKVPPICVGTSMSGDRSVFVGKWRWYKTTIEQWFDLGPSVYIDYTPQSQGFEYYFTISTDGQFKGYKNGQLLDSFILSEIQVENFSSTSWQGINTYKDCTLSFVEFTLFNPTVSNDIVTTLEYPINFDDQQNQLKSYQNFFVRE